MTLLIRGAYRIFNINGSFWLPAREEGAYGSHENLVTLIDAEVGIAEKKLAGVLPAQGDDFVAEDIEIEALPRVFFVARTEEVVASFEEIPSVVRLDAP